MGVVYHAEQSTLGRDATIKVLHPQLSARPELAERFQHEARAASQLNHPHIVTIYNYGAMDDGTLSRAMEYLDGMSLEQLIARSGALRPGRAVRIVTQIAQSLPEAHGNGIVHRDLKPQNVMLRRRGLLERVGVRRGPAARATARVRRIWQDSRRWASSLVRRVRKR